MKISVKKMVITGLASLSLAGFGVTAMQAENVFADSNAKITQVTTSKTMTQAASIALKAAGSGQVTEVDFKIKKNTPVYDVTIMDGTTETSYRINANTGEIIRTKVEQETGKLAQLLTTTKPKKSVEDIAKQVAKDYAGLTVKSIDLKNQSGTLIYEVELVDGIKEITATYGSDDAIKMYESVDYDD